MKNLRLAYFASLLCFAGAAIQILYGLLSIPYPYGPDAYYGWDEALWALANIGMVGAVVGLVALDIARPRWLAVMAGVLATLGHLIRIVVSVRIILLPTWDPSLTILLSILFMLLGMILLGITILLGKQLAGWQAWTPLLVPLFGFVTAAIYPLNQSLHFILLGLWGIPWMLVGFVVFTNARQPKEKMAKGAAIHVTHSP
jgi:hypothetical protein